MLFHRLYGLCSRMVTISTVGGRRGRWRTHSVKQTASIAEEPHWNTGAIRRRCHSDVAELYDRESVRGYLQQLMEEFRELTDTLQQAYLCDSDRKELTRKRTELLPVANIYGRIEQAQRDHEEVCSLLRASSGSKDKDEQLMQLLEEEEEQLSSKILALRKDLVTALVPADPRDSSDVMLEVVSGRTTGGDICQQFTGEMLEMYQGFSSFKNWDFEVYNSTPAEYGKPGLDFSVRLAGTVCEPSTLRRSSGKDIRQWMNKSSCLTSSPGGIYISVPLSVVRAQEQIILKGGLHHAAMRIAGDNVYRHLKHEGGTHRVQRIPEVGQSSRMQRIHTGTMTVIVLPQLVEVDVHIEPKDLRIDTFRSRGAGGQSVNTTDSAVRIVHLPTGISAECQQTRSQLKNRDMAMNALRARLYQSMMGKEIKQRRSARKQQVGNRSQSERIRSYNFSQDRVTDHRTGYVTRDIKEFMRGGEALDDLIADVLEHTERKALLEIVENSSTLTKLESSPCAD